METALAWMHIEAHLKNHRAHPEAVRVKSAREKAGEQQQRTGVLIWSFDRAESALSCRI